GSGGYGIKLRGGNDLSSARGCRLWNSSSVSPSYNGFPTIWRAYKSWRPPSNETIPIPAKGTTGTRKSATALSTLCRSLSALIASQAPNTNRSLCSGPTGRGLGTATTSVCDGIYDRV